LHIAWPDAFQQLGQGTQPAEKVRSALRQALSQLSLHRDRFEVVAMHFPDDWMPYLRSREFDAHDELKALGAQF
jgi:hypothetical protein